MATRLDDVRRRRPLDPDARKRVDTIKRAMRLEVALSELREMRGISQAAVAEHLETSRPNISRIEKEVDVRLSTLERQARVGDAWNPTNSTIHGPAEPSHLTAAAPPSPAIRHAPRHAGARSGAHPHLRPTQPFPTLMPADR